MSKPFTKVYHDLSQELDLSPIELLILCRVLSYQQSGKRCTENLEDMAKMWNVGKKTIQRAIKRLAEKKIISVTKSQYSNSYTANENIIFNMVKMTNIKSGMDKMTTTEVKMTTLERSKSPFQMVKMTPYNIIEDNIIRSPGDTPFEGGGRTDIKEEEKNFKKEVTENEQHQEQYQPEYIAFD